jgi:hypothetical protein
MFLGVRDSNLNRSKKFIMPRIIFSLVNAGNQKV